MELNTSLEYILGSVLHGGTQKAQCHRTTEWVSLEGTTVDHLIQPLCLSRVIVEQFAQDFMQAVLDYLQ